MQELTFEEVLHRLKHTTMSKVLDAVDEATEYYIGQPNTKQMREWKN